MKGQFIQVSDDGAPEINIVVHGYDPTRDKPTLDILISQVNHAELRGQVYIYHWASGTSLIPGGRYIGRFENYEILDWMVPRNAFFQKSAVGKFTFSLAGV